MSEPKRKEQIIQEKANLINTRLKQKNNLEQEIDKINLKNIIDALDIWYLLEDNDNIRVRDKDDKELTLTCKNDVCKFFVSGDSDKKKKKSFTSKLKCAVLWKILSHYIDKNRSTDKGLRAALNETSLKVIEKLCPLLKDDEDNKRKSLTSETLEYWLQWISKRKGMEQIEAICEIFSGALHRAKKVDPKKKTPSFSDIQQEMEGWRREINRDKHDVRNSPSDTNEPTTTQQNPVENIPDVIPPFSPEPSHSVENYTQETYITVTPVSSPLLSQQESAQIDVSSQPGTPQNIDKNPSQYSTSQYLTLLKQTSNSIVQSNMDASLHEACRKSDNNKIKALVQNGARVNARDSKGITPLMITCYKKNYKGVEYLLNCGAAVDETEEGGKTALMFAAIAADLNIDPASDLLHHKNIVQHLLYQGASTTVKDKQSRTALMIAVDSSSRNRLDIVNCLGSHMVESGITLDERDDNGETALMYTCKSEVYLELVEFLVDSGASTNSRSSNGKTPLMFAAQYAINCAMEDGIWEGEETFKVLRYLIAKGAMINERDAETNTALDLVLGMATDIQEMEEYKSRAKKVVEFLLQSGFDPSVKERDSIPSDIWELVLKYRDHLRGDTTESPAVVEQMDEDTEQPSETICKEIPKRLRSQGESDSALLKRQKSVKTKIRDIEKEIRKMQSKKNKLQKELEEIEAEIVLTKK